MQYKFAENVDALQPSAIREILKFTSMPGVISFAAGNPAPEAFPVDTIRKISAELFEKDPILALQYNITEGYPKLRDLLKQRMAAQQCFDADADDLITTSGAQQANELSCKVLLNRGDTLFCEAPSFIGSLNAFRSYGVDLVGIPMEQDGMDLAAMEEAVKASKSPKLVYVIPNFQNPTGRVMSLEKRKGLYELACKYDFIILEDNPYGDLRFAGSDVPSIKSMDTEHRVIYSGTFSKILAPGLRVGYVSAPKEIIAKITVCKQVADVHTNIWAQAVCAEFLERTDMDTYLENCVRYTAGSATSWQTAFAVTSPARYSGKCRRAVCSCGAPCRTTATCRRSAPRQCRSTPLPLSPETPFWWTKLPRPRRSA